MTRSDMLLAVLISSAAQIPALFYFAAYSDRNGRIGIYKLGAILMGLWAFAVFPIMNSGVLLPFCARTMHRANFHRDDVWTPGGFAHRVIQRRGALFWCIAGLSNWRYFRWRSRANSGNSLARYIWQSDLDKRIHRFGLHTDLALCACP